MRKFQPLGVGAILIGLMYAACGSKGQDQNTDERIPVQVAGPTRIDVEDVLHYYGEIRADQEARLDFNFSGRIAKYHYEVGEKVPRGAVMAILNQEEILAQLEQTKVADEKAQADLQRVERLHADQIISDDRLELARVGAKQARAAFVMAQEALKNSSVIAPFSGLVAEKNGEVGEYYNSMMGGPPVYRLVNIDKVKMLIGIPESEVPMVKKGQEARILLDTYPGELFLGQVTRVGLTIDRLSRTMEAEITVPNASMRLKPGMMADIDLVTGRRQAVLSIPQKALMQDMGLENIFVVLDGKAVIKEVVSGVRQGDVVEIVQGLNEEDQVVIEGQFDLKEGDQVKSQPTTAFPKER